VCHKEGGEKMKCCRHCQALNYQDTQICEYCFELLPSAASMGQIALAKYHLSSPLRRRLIYLAVAIIVLVIAGLARR
jgi:hypothetical protein